jgi:multidrug transporter EmrE-like cation transporter
MSSVTHRAIGDAVRAAVGGCAAGQLAFLALGPTASLGLQVWAVLTGWALCLLLGGGLGGLRRSTIQSLFGACVALVALAFATHQPDTLGIDFAAWAALGVALTVALATLAARLPTLASIPASLLGYVSVLVATLPDYRIESIFTPSIENPAVGAVVSLMIGALFACAAEDVAQRLRSRFDRAAEGPTAKA